MSRGARFDRFMVHVSIGQDDALDGLTAPEKWCWVAGVLATAAVSPVRGWLFATETVVAEPRHIARRAGVRVGVAVRTLEKARERGLIAFDSCLQADHITDWELFNPQPKHDRTAAERMRRMRARKRNPDPVLQRNAAAVTEGIRSKEEKEVNTPLPPAGSVGGVLEILDLGKFDPLTEGEDMAILAAIGSRPHVDPLGAARVAVDWSHGEGWRTRSRSQTFRHAMRDAEKIKVKEEHGPTAAGMTPARDECLDCSAPIKTGVRCRECDHRLYERKTGEAA